MQMKETAVTAKGFKKKNSRGNKKCTIKEGFARAVGCRLSSQTGEAPLGAVSGGRNCKHHQWWGMMAPALLSLGFGSSKRWDGGPNLRLAARAHAPFKVQTDLFPVLEHGTGPSTSMCISDTLHDQSLGELETPGFD